MGPLSTKIIKEKILDNYIDYQYLFLEFQSKLLTNLYSRYQSVENGILFCTLQNKPIKIF